MDTERTEAMLPTVISREGRAFYLAQCDAGRLCNLVDDLLNNDDVLADITVVKPAATGSIMRAIADAVLQADRPGLAPHREALLDLISDTRADLAAHRATESGRLAATIVEFEELD